MVQAKDDVNGESASNPTSKISGMDSKKYKAILEEQKKERQKKERDDEEKRQMLQKVSEQRKESIKSQKATDLSRIIEEQTQYRQKLIEIEKGSSDAKENSR